MAPFNTEAEGGRMVKEWNLEAGKKVKYPTYVLCLSHWDFLILIPRLILTSFLYIKKVEIYKTEFKLGKNNKIQ